MTRLVACCPAVERPSYLPPGALRVENGLLAILSTTADHRGSHCSSVANAVASPAPALGVFTVAPLIAMV